MAPTPTPPAGNSPVARDDTAAVSSGDLAFVAVLANDTPAAGQTLTVKSITSPASNGDCSIGLDLLEVVYAPTDGFTGTDSCVYEACDLVPQCDTATVTFTVEPPTPPPTVSSIQWIVYTFLCPVFDSSSCTTIL